MANIYLSDEAKKLLETISTFDRRTQDGEIMFLLERRAEEIEGLGKVVDLLASKESQGE